MDDTVIRKSSSDGRDGVSPSVSECGATTFFRNMGMSSLPKRKQPAHGVLISRALPTIVFLTVCAKDRRAWIANPEVHSQLVKIWHVADAWKVGYYLLMPDHLHLFCAPYKLEFTLKNWVIYWKRKFSCLKLKETGRWQSDYWDTRLRHGENYSNKWEYVRQNPVRKGLVSRSDDWPYQGILNELRW